MTKNDAAAQAEQTLTAVEANRERLQQFLRETYADPMTAFGALLDMVDAYQAIFLESGFDISKEMKQFVERGPRHE